MAIKTEANHAWLEQIVYQANNMSEVEFMLGLGGPIAGLKGISTHKFIVDISPHHKNFRILCARSNSNFRRSGI